jgi:hypothetical protein
MDEVAIIAERVGPGARLYTSHNTSAPGSCRQLRPLDTLAEEWI